MTVSWHHYVEAYACSSDHLCNDFFSLDWIRLEMLLILYIWFVRDNIISGYATFTWQICLKFYSNLSAAINNVIDLKDLCKASTSCLLLAVQTTDFPELIHLFSSMLVHSQFWFSIKRKLLLQNSFIMRRVKCHVNLCLRCKHKMHIVICKYMKSRAYIVLHNII